MHKQIAVDLAKSVYQVAESVRAGQVSQRKRLNREAFRRYIQEQAEPVEWLMEACGTAHYWGRFAQSLGHRVTLLHPRYVRPYRRRNKTDRNDCEAILEAARCAGIHPVPVKTHEQQQLQRPARDLEEEPHPAHQPAARHLSRNGHRGAGRYGCLSSGGPRTGRAP